MKLHLQGIDKSGIIRVGVDGTITASDFADGAKNPLEAVAGMTWSVNRIALDLSKVGYVDSSAVGWLLNTQRAMQNAGGKLAIHSVPVSIQQIFDLLKIEKVLPLKRNEAEALQLLAGE